MELYGLEPTAGQQALAVGRLLDCNTLTREYGLELSLVQMQELVVLREQALKQAGRVEFGEGIAPRIIEVFCDSPYITQENYFEALVRLQELFYFYKTEAMERMGDEELLEQMRASFDGDAQGSLEYLGETALEAFCQRLRQGTQPEEQEQEEPATEDDWD